MISWVLEMWLVYLQYLYIFFGQVSCICFFVSKHICGSQRFRHELCCPLYTVFRVVDFSMKNHRKDDGNFNTSWTSMDR